MTVSCLGVRGGVLISHALLLGPALLFQMRQLYVWMQLSKEAGRGDDDKG